MANWYRPVHSGIGRRLIWSSHAWGAFKNHVDRLWPFFDLPPTSSGKSWTSCPYYLYKGIKGSRFSLYPRSFFIIYLHIKIVLAKCTKINFLNFVYLMGFSHISTIFLNNLMVMAKYTQIFFFHICICYAGHLSAVWKWGGKTTDYAKSGGAKPKIHGKYEWFLPKFSKSGGAVAPPAPPWINALYRMLSSGKMFD